MAEMLAKFRIDYSDLIMIPDYNKKPQETTVNYFESIIANFRSEGNGMKGITYCYFKYYFFIHGKTSCTHDFTLII